MNAIRTRTFLAAALLSAAVSLLCSCSLPGEPEPPKSGTFAFALAAANRGDLATLRSELSKGQGLHARARAAMAKLDPDAWLILQGARWREYDLAACYRAGDDAAMAAALGFSDDALTSTLLRAPSHVTERFSDGRRYFRDADPPAQLFKDLAPKPCAPTLAAYVMKYKAELSGRVCMCLAGFEGNKPNELHATEDFTTPDEPTINSVSFPDLASALQAREFTPLLPILPDTLPPSARSLELAALDDSGTIYWVAFAARNGRWQLRFAYRNTQEQRLQRAREEALRNIREAARAWYEKVKYWPSQDELGLRAQAYVDPAGENGERGWQLHATEPRAGIRLAAGGKLPPPDDQPVAWTLDGRHGIAWDGRFLTHP
jgi:hypothetical protein